MKKVDTQRSPDFRIYDLLPVLDDLVWKYRKSLLVVVVDVWMETFELGVGILPYLFKGEEGSLTSFLMGLAIICAGLLIHKFLGKKKDVEE